MNMSRIVESPATTTVRPRSASWSRRASLGGYVQPAGRHLSAQVALPARFGSRPL